MNTTTIKYQLKLLFAQLFGMVNLTTVQGQRIYKTAVSLIGLDASPKDLATDDLGCAESVSTILATLFPPFQVILGTYALFLALRGAPEFVEVTNPLPGDVIISPTGLGGQGGIAHGHTGIVGENRIVISNDSATGKWSSNYTLDSWRARYAQRGGYPVFFFRRIIN